MKLFVLMGQRKERYPGEFGPEALACMDEIGDSDNPDYLADAKAKADASGQFEATAIIPLQVDRDAIMQFLRPADTTVPARVLAE